VVRYAAHRRSYSRWHPSPQTAKERARTSPKQEPHPRLRGLLLLVLRTGSLLHILPTEELEEAETGLGVF